MTVFDGQTLQTFLSEVTSSENLPTSVLLVILVAFLFAWNLARWSRRNRRRRGHYKRSPHPAPPLQLIRTGAPNGGFFDSAEQLRVVSNATFEPRRLLSKSEARAFYAVESAIRTLNLSWRVMAQVSLGEILASSDPKAYRAINSKRVDILIITSGGEPLAAVEYQGSGHYIGSSPIRDAVKREALRRAGVDYIEIKPEHAAEDILFEIQRLARSRQASADSATS